jgi:hypothetical protein
MAKALGVAAGVESRPADKLAIESAKTHGNASRMTAASLNVNTARSNKLKNSTQRHCCWRYAGTDPLSLGVEGIGDLMNGTNNAEQSIKGVEKAWNRSLTKQVFTDPNGAAKRVGKDIEQTGRDIVKTADQVGKDVGKASAAVDKELKKTGKTVDREVKKAGKSIDKAAKDVGQFVDGIFGKK